MSRVIWLLWCPSIASAATVELWLDGADPLADGSSPSSSITTWYDKSNYERHAVSSGVGWTAGGLNGQGVVTLDGSQSLEAPLGWDAYIAPEPYMTFTVFRDPSPASISEMVWANRPSPGPTHTIVVRNDGRLGTRVYGGTSALGSVVTGAPHVVAMGVNGSAISQLDCSDEPLPTVGSADASTSGVSTVIGARDNAVQSAPSNTSSYFSGDIAEFIVVKGAMTPTEIGDVTQYLGDKWGLPVGSCGDAAAGAQWIDVRSNGQPVPFLGPFGLLALGGMLAGGGMWSAGREPTASRR